MLGNLVVALVAAFNREPDLVVEVLADMESLGDHTDRHQLCQEMLQLIEKYYGLPLHRFDMQTLFYEITNLVRRNDVTLPREFVMFGKALVADRRCVPPARSGFGFAQPGQTQAAIADRPAIRPRPCRQSRWPSPAGTS